MKANFGLLSVYMIAVASAAIGQVQPDSSQLSAWRMFANSFDSGSTVHWNEKCGTPDIITFSNPRSFANEPGASAQGFLHDIEVVLKLRENIDQMRTEETRVIDNVHYIRTKQYYKSVPVIGGEFVFTVLPGAKVQCALGRYLKDIQCDVKPRISIDQALSYALASPPASLSLKDSLVFSQLAIYAKDTTYRLVWQLRIPLAEYDGAWDYLVSASDGAVLDSVNTAIREAPSMLLSQPEANVYLHHPGIDASYVTISPINVDNSGYLQGTYVNVVNDAVARAYSSSSDFRYQLNDTHFDEANLFYHIDTFRRVFWNSFGFNAFTQLNAAHAHHVFATPGAEYRDGQLNFSDGQGMPGFSSFAREDKIIMHEYTHIVTDHVAHISGTTYDEKCAINDGNSDYFAATFTGRTKSGEYACWGYPILQRDIAAPRIADYDQYNNSIYYQGYPLREPHFGGELWSRCLWDLRSTPSIGKDYADRDIYYGLYGIPRTSTFLQYRQAIINADNNYFSGSHSRAIQNAFGLRGIGDPTVPSVSGPSRLSVGQQGTWTVSTDWGTGNYTYAWYFRSNDTDGQWSGPLSFSASYSTRMYDFDGYLEVRADVTARITRVDGTSGTMSSSGTAHVTCVDCGPCQGCPKSVESTPDTSRLVVSASLPMKCYILSQNYPNPVNPTTEISFSLPRDAYVKLVVYDMLGKEVARVVDTQMGPGYHTATWDASKVASGIYIYRFSANDFVQVKRMVVVK